MRYPLHRTPAPQPRNLGTPKSKVRPALRSTGIGFREAPKKVDQSASSAAQRWNSDDRTAQPTWVGCNEKLDVISIEHNIEALLSEHHIPAIVPRHRMSRAVAEFDISRVKKLLQHRILVQPRVARHAPVEMRGIAMLALEIACIRKTTQGSHHLLVPAHSLATPAYSANDA